MILLVVFVNFYSVNVNTIFSGEIIQENMAFPAGEYIEYMVQYALDKWNPG